MRLLLTACHARHLPGALAFAGVMGVYAYYARDLPDPGSLSSRQRFQTARILDRNGRLAAGAQRPDRRPSHAGAASPRSPPVMREATIAAEDASFFDNPGFDPARRAPRHLPVGPHRRAPERRLDHHPAARQEHPAGARADRRAQDQGSLPGDGADAPLLQGPDPRDVPERDLVRQPRVRHRGRRANLLRQARAAS